MSHQGFINFADKLPEGMILLSSRGQIIAINRVAVQLLQRTKQQLNNQNFSLLTDLSEQEVIEKLRGCARSRTPAPVAINISTDRCTISNGFLFTPATSLEPAQIILRLEKHQPLSSNFHILSREVEKQKKAHKLLKKSRAELIKHEVEFEALVAKRTKQFEFQKNALDEHSIVSVADTKGNITYANKKLEEISLYSQQEIIGSNHRLLRSNVHPDSFFKDMWDTIASGQIWHGEVCNKAKDGSTYWVSSTIVPQLNEKGKPEQYIAIRTDITKIKTLEISRNKERQQASIRAEISQILQKPLELKVRMEQVLSTLCLFPEMKVQQKAGVFLIKNDKLHMFAMFGEFSEEFTIKEECIDMGACLCGRVAISGMLRVSDNCFTDHDHDHSFENMTAHGHYIVPLKYANEVLGVMYLYTDPFPSKAAELLEMLSGIGYMLGLAISNEYSQQALENEKTIADKANKAKSEFLSSMSHELRTPLNAILGFGQLLESDTDHPLNEDQKESINYILSSGKHLLSLVNEVLELSAIEAGKVAVSIEPINLIEVVTDVESLITPIARKSNIRLELESKEDIVISADYTKFKQVLINLISNAIKYNKQAGSVTVSWENTERNTARLNVIDTGIGIPEAKRDKVFGAFNRLGQEASAIEGTGIGLLVTKDLIELMSGTIGFDSVEGHGSTFWIELPLVSAQELKDTEASEAPEAPEAPVIGKKHILYVEDNPANQRLMQSIFDRLPHKLEMVENAELGQERALDEDFDLILMDLNLPGMDGNELTKRLRETEQYKNKPIVAITAKAMSHDIKEASDLFDAYVTKPLDISHLHDVLNTFLKAK